MFGMKPLLIKVLVIALAVLLVSAGAVYAVSYFYQVETTGQVTVEESPSKTGALPGLQISPTSFNFGNINADHGPGANHISNKFALTVKNVGSAEVELRFIFDNLPEGLLAEEDQAGNAIQSAGTLLNTTKVTFGLHGTMLAPGSTHTYYPYLVAGPDITPGTYQFKIIVKGL